MTREESTRHEHPHCLASRSTASAAFDRGRPPLAFSRSNTTSDHNSTAPKTSAMDGMLLSAEDGNVNEDISKLREAWVAESTCPELRQFDDVLVEDVLEQIRNQQQGVDEADEGTDEAFTATLYQMEIDRWV